MIESHRLLGAPARAGKTRVVAVDGRSGAGKTSLAAELRGVLEAPVVTLEDLYGGWDGLERGVDLLVSEVLEPLRAGRDARVPRYDWVARDWGTPWVLEPPEVLIVEGVGAGARRAAAYASTVIWMEAAESVRKKRALDRDGETFAPYWDMWAAQEDAMLARERTPDRADLVIDGVSGSIVYPDIPLFPADQKKILVTFTCYHPPELPQRKKLPRSWCWQPRTTGRGRHMAPKGLRFPSN